MINLCCQYTSLFWLSDLYFKLLIWYFSMSVPKSYFFKSQTHLIIICRLHSHHPVTVILVSHGETVETVLDFIFLGSKITADGDCSHEIKRRLLLGRKVMTNLNSILKRRDITLPTKVHPVKAMVFPVVMYGCESWTVKKAEHWRIDAFELWCWRRLLRIPWTARRFNQSILKEISPRISWEEMMLKLKPHAKSWLIGKDSDAGRDWGLEEKGQTEDEMAGWHYRLHGHEFELTPGVGDGQGGLACCNSWGCKESDMTEWLNWTELNHISEIFGQINGILYREETWKAHSCFPGPRPKVSVSPSNVNHQF